LLDGGRVVKQPGGTAVFVTSASGFGAGSRAATTARPKSFKVSFAGTPSVHAAGDPWPVDRRPGSGGLAPGALPAAAGGGGDPAGSAGGVAGGAEPVEDIGAPAPVIDDRSGPPVAVWAAGEPGLVRSPFAGPDRLIDVSGIAPGTPVKCPYTGRVFLVPGAPGD
jgi:hypothetical protein